MKSITLILIAIFVGLSQKCLIAQNHDEPVYYTEKILKYDDFNYDRGIQSVMFYQNSGSMESYFTPPILPLQQDTTLSLEFDELGDQTHQYYFQLVHCNADWQPSGLADMEFLNEYNEFHVPTYAVSFNTGVHYTHYSLQIPVVKLAGNYVVIVYRNGNKEDFVLSRRFLVVRNLVQIQPAFKFSIGAYERFTHQQIDFMVNYGRFERVLNPVQEFKIVVRQNNRWDNAKLDLKPIYYREYEKMLDFQLVDFSNQFKGLNEYRTFDCRRVRTTGINIRKVERLEDGFHVYVLPDEDRSRQGYAQNIDRNGKFFTGNNEMGQNTGDADYVWVHFELKAEEQPGAIYLFGAFTDWRVESAYRLHYSSESQSYKGVIKIKQGYYNYSYVHVQQGKFAPDESKFEGSFSQTRNTYDIIIYHRAMGARADEIVGYYSREFNGF